MRTSIRFRAGYAETPNDRRSLSFKEAKVPKSISSEMNLSVN